MGAPAYASLAVHRVIVGVGDFGVSNNPGVTLSTYALGSCIAVAAYDGTAKVGGLLHLMLPESRLAPEKATAQPAMFADTGLPAFFRALVAIEFDLARARLFVAGGASVLSTSHLFKIGERNTRATEDYLSAHGFPVHQSAIGGTINRTLHLNIETGAITLKTPETNATWSLAA